MILRELRAAYTEAELPIIVMETAGDHSADILALGASDCVTKPLDYGVLLARLGAQMARKRFEALWRESDERYALAVRAANDGIWDWELTTNAFTYSPRWKHLLGYEEHERCPSLEAWFARIAPEDREQVRGALAAHLGGETLYFACEYRILDRDDTYRWMYSRGLASFNASGKPTRMAGSLTDITVWKVADRVTGLPNSVVLVDRISRAIEHSRRRHGKAFALLLLDLDRFSMVNDGLGYAAGDHLLRIVARRLEACLRAEDLVMPYGKSQSIARMPGDKFAVFIEDIAYASDVIRIATRILHVLKDPFVLEARKIYLTMSIGITLSTSGYHCPEDVVRDAEIALHRAKAHGKARYEIFDAAMHSQAMARLQVETELHDAIEREEFRAFYQPIVSLTSGQICGFEALVRWQHPQRGLLSPQAFITVAEETGLIVPIGVWLLREACRQVQHWQTQFPLSSHMYLSVNLCGKELLEPHLIRQIARILDETRLAAGCLRLEITESIRPRSRRRPLL
jgi:diguanylate cyclase (GGDEF)-like protein/PAS domain S-box-containing protein